MKPPVSKDRDSCFIKTKDQEEIIMLITYGLEISNTERVGRRVIFYFDRERATPYMKMWKSNTPMPVSDIRDVLRAYRLFNQVVHGEV
jgi:hypothetical protein